MTATLEQLVNVRSQLVVDEVLPYLDTLAERMAELPAYYPAHLRTDETGGTRFDAIRQMVQVVEDRTAFERWRAEERERLRATGLDYDRLAYDPTRARPEDDERDAMRRERPKPPPPVPWDEHAGQRFRRAVILGDPGFGKTWLLRYEARRLAREAARQLHERTIRPDDLTLPIFVRLSDVNQSDDPLQDALVTLAGAGRSEAFLHFVQQKLNSDRCVILLDAWDEVPVEVPPAGQPLAYRPHHRQRLGQRLEAFARQFPRPRLLLTSRIVGYTASPIPDALELELLAFDRPHIDQFVRVWFGDATEMAEQFLAMLRQNHQVRGLARIPLMLALMTRAYQERQLGFPTRRVELYDRCLRGLLRDWKEEKERRRISDIRLERTLRRLAEGALGLHVDRREQFTEPQLAKALGFDLEYDSEAERAEELVESLKRDGILITAGEHRDAPLLFLHRTFHEYLAACALARRANSEGWPAIAGLMDKKAWLPSWQEVIILLAGQLTDPTPFLKLLADEEKDDYFRHRLALAAFCLSEFKSEIRDLQSEIIDDITTAAFSIYWEHRRNDTDAAVSHLAHALPALGQVNGRMENTPLVEWLCQRLQDKEGNARHVRRGTMGALRWMGEMAAQNPDVLPPLLASLRSPDWHVRIHAAEALGKMREVAAGHPKVMPTLLGALRGADSDIREQAAEALGEIGEVAARHPEILPALVEVALRDANWDVRREAAMALGRMGAAAVRHPEVVPRLLAALRYSNSDVRKQAAEALGQMGEAAVQHPEVVPTLLAALRSAKSYMREQAAKLLGDVGATAARHPEVLPLLVGALQDTDNFVRARAAEALGEIGVAAAQHPDAISTLLATLWDTDASVRGHVAKTLGRMGEVAVQHSEVIPTLLAALQDPDWNVRTHTTQALGGMGQAAARHPKVLPALVEVALDDADGFVRGHALEALGEMGVAAVRHPKVLPVLVDALQDADLDVRVHAAKALGEIGEAAAQHPEVIPLLVAALCDADWVVRAVLLDVDVVVRIVAAEALGRMGEAAARHPKALPALLAAMCDADWGVRRRTAKALEQMGEAVSRYSKVVPVLLVAALQDADQDVRKAAAEALGRMGEAVTRHPEVLPALVTALDDTKACWTTAIALGRLMAQGVRFFQGRSGKWEGRTVAELANE